MFPEVPAGCAVVAFAYYNVMGIREQGLGQYLAHFAGPMPILAPLMIPIELVSHMARPLSLTIRLFANMYAGEKVTLVFLKPDLLGGPGAVHGAARICFFPAGLYLRPDDDDVRRRSGSARTLIGIMPLQCEPGCKRMTGTTS